MPQLQDNQQVLPIKPSQSVGGASELQAIIKSIAGKMHTCQLAEVVKVYDTDELSQVGFVDIKQLVPMIDGSNNAYDTGVIVKAPYFRLQGGANAIVINPKVGDLGLAMFCERDISMVKRNRKNSPPNTRRQYSVNDAVYLGGFLNGIPEQYIMFTDNEVTIKAKSKITLDAPEIVSTGNFTSIGFVKSMVDVFAKTLSLLGFGGTYNTHNHLENGQGNNTNQPNQQVNNG